MAAYAIVRGVTRERPCILALLRFVPLLPEADLYAEDGEVKMCRYTWEGELEDVR
jgi:hypothetical protein